MARRVERMKYSSAVLLAGAALGFVVQYRKYEQGIDGLFDWSFLPLLLASIAATAFAWGFWYTVLVYAFKRSADEAKESATMVFVPLYLLFLYPLCTPLKMKGIYYIAGTIVFAISALVAVADLAQRRAGVSKKISFHHLSLILLLFLGTAGAILLGNAFHNLVRQLEHARSEKTETRTTLTGVKLDSQVRPALNVGNGITFKTVEELQENPFLVFSVGSEQQSAYQSLSITISAESATHQTSYRIPMDSAFEGIGEVWKDFIWDLNEFKNQEARLSLGLGINRLKRLFQIFARKRTFFIPAWNYIPDRYLLSLYVAPPRVIHSPEKEEFNILLISLDTLRADHLSVYGYSRDTSPNLAQLAEEGIVFTNFFSPSTWTLPAHMSLFSSLYPSAHRVHNKEQSIRELDFPTLPQLLKTVGYYNVALTDGGFVGSTYGFHLGFDSYYQKGEDFGVRIGKAIECLKEYRALKFFLFLHTYEIHSYVTMKNVHQSYYANAYNGEIRGHFQDLVRQLALEQGRLSSKDTQFIKDIYDGAIRYTDECLGELFRALKDIGLYDNTLIIVTSDHGEAFGQEHGNREFIEWGHGRIPYETQIHVPLIVKMPKSWGEYEGHISSEQSLLDIVPTLADILDIKISHKVQGRSWLPLLKEDGLLDRRALFALQAPHHSLNTAISVRHEGRKYIVSDYGSARQREELYDLVNDPTELNNIVDVPDVAEERRRLSEAVDSYLKDCAEFGNRVKVGNEISEEVKAELKALGYLQ